MLNGRKFLPNATHVYIVLIIQQIITRKSGRKWN